ncbi:MAG: hypothetical protein HY272_14035 [Gammaproteobacteria bacterium]|nr:hypothetical protein [Gammaproteobacteria bacterium]
MKQLIYGLAILAPMCISHQALAKTKPLTLSYSEIALRYEMFSTTLSGTTQNLNGGGTYLALSYDAFKNVAINLDYGNGTADTTYKNNKWELDIKNAASIGASYHTPIYYDTDLVFGASILGGKTTLKVNGSPAINSNKNGYGVNLGIRSLVARHLELNASAELTRIKSVHVINLTNVQAVTEYNSSSKLTVGGAYYFTNQVSAGLHYSVDSDSHSTVFSISAYY